MTPTIAIIFILLIVFFLICLECILRKRVSYIISNLNEEQDVIESHIREIIFLNPQSEIIVICTPRDSETLTVLTKLQNEYPQLHIIK
jgi:cellulose synthase/poly-beta-1,6-N-acetylglucosamine synthase-like glycosyltransferase